MNQVSVQSGRVTVVLGATTVVVPVGQIDAMIRALDAARLLAAVDPVAQAADSGVVANVGVVAEGRAAKVPARQVQRAEPARRGRPPRAVAVAASTEAPKGVGELIVAWMEQRTGWHTTETLLDAVVSEKMTDKNPLRALMIALGKRKGGAVQTDGAGHWALATERSAAPVVSAEIYSPEAHAGRQPRARRSDRQGAADDADSEDSSAAPAVGGRLIRVKAGEDRKAALLTEREVLTREQAADAVQTMQFKWDSASRSERERIRKNLFGGS